MRKLRTSGKKGGSINHRGTEGDTCGVGGGLVKDEYREARKRTSQDHKKV